MYYRNRWKEFVEVVQVITSTLICVFGIGFMLVFFS